MKICKNGLLGMAVLVLFLGPFVTANGDDGIFGGTTPAGGATISSGQVAVNTALGTICGLLGMGAPAGIACDITGFGGAAGSGIALQNLSPQAAIQADTVSITSPYQFIRNINKQAQKLIDCQSDELKSKGKHRCIPKGGGAGDVYGFIGALGVSINGGGGIGDRENADGQTGFELDTRIANLTIDYSFSKQLIGGFSFGYLGTERTLGLASGSLDSDSYRFAPFILFRPTSNSYLTVMGGYALVNYDSTRSVVPVSGGSGTVTLTDATAEYDADQYFASVGGGYTFAFMDGWSLKGYGRGDYSHTDIEGFQESGGNESVSGASTNVSYAMKVGGQSINSVTSTVGAELSYTISSTILSAVIIPRLRAEWVHEFENSARTAQFTFNQTGVANTSGAFTVAGPERDWANLGFGLQMLFPHAIVGYVNYEALLIENASNHSITGGIRINF